MSEKHDGYHESFPMPRITLSGIQEMPFVPPVTIDALSWSVDGQSVLAYGPEDVDGMRTISRYDRNGDHFAFRAGARYRRMADGSWMKQGGDQP